MANNGEGEWQTVSRRKGKQGGATSQNLTLDTQPYLPYHTKPLYSKALSIQKPSFPSTNKNPTQRKTDMASITPPSSPPPSQATYYISPHSPTRLRFPPSSHFMEWKGRCFRCCRTGHSAAVCRNPLRCGKCWGEGHNGTHCKAQMLNPAAMPYWSGKAVPARPKTAPSTAYDDLLRKPCPLSEPTMPNNRPNRVAYFADRDPAFLTEIAKLNNGVVFNTHGKELGFKLHDVAQFATRTKLVEKHEISIGILAQDRFLIMLHVGVAPETFINATSPSLWDAGFSFQPWSPLDGGRLAIPEYKVLLTLHNVPPHMRRDKDIAGAVSTFGVFLGTIPQEGNLNLSIWTTALAVNRLERIPKEIEMYAGGVEYVITTQVINWLRSPLY